MRGFGFSGFGSSGFGLSGPVAPSAAPLVTGLSGFRFSIFELTGFRLSDFRSSGFRPSGPVAPYSMAPLVTKHSLA